MTGLVREAVTRSRRIGAAPADSNSGRSLQAQGTPNSGSISYPVPVRWPALRTFTRPCSPPVSILLAGVSSFQPPSLSLSRWRLPVKAARYTTQPYRRQCRPLRHPVPVREEPQIGERTCEKATQTEAPFQRSKKPGTQPGFGGDNGLVLGTLTAVRPPTSPANS